MTSSKWTNAVAARMGGFWLHISYFVCLQSTRTGSCADTTWKMGNLGIGVIEHIECLNRIRGRDWCERGWVWPVCGHYCMMSSLSIRAWVSLRAWWLTVTT